MSKWISVKECLPEIGQPVLVYRMAFFGSRPVMTVRSRAEDDTHPFGGNVYTYWMPLPESPARPEQEKP